MRRTSESVTPASELAAERTPWPLPLDREQVIEVLEPWVTPERKARLMRVIDARISNVTVLMDAPHDPHHAAAVVRTSDAFVV